MSETSQAPSVPATSEPLPPAPGATTARPAALEHKDSHWYTVSGEPCYEVKGKTTGRPRPTNLSDARARNLLPSVTAIINLLHKEGLVNWKIEQACLAVLTTPRLPGEKDDEFAKRVLKTEKVQEQESTIAKDKGTAIHDAIANYFGGTPTDKELDPFIIPAISTLESYGNVIDVEKVIVGIGYAGRMDLLQDCEEHYRLWDVKSTKRLPDPRKGAWLEHRLQLAAYAKAIKLDATKPIICGNIYISSVEPGAHVVCEHEDWENAYEYGFKPLVTFWQWMNQHFPSQPGAEPATAPIEPLTHSKERAEIVDAMISAAKGPGEIKGKKVVWTEGVKL